MDSFPVATHLANAAEFNASSYLAGIAAKASTQAYDNSLVIPFPALDPKIKTAISSQFKNVTIRFSGDRAATPPLSGHIFHTVFRYAVRARFEQKRSVLRESLPTLVIGSAFREVADYSSNPNVSYWFYANEPKDTDRIVRPMLKAIADKANELARKSSVRFQTRSLSYNSALALLAKLDAGVPVTLDDWVSSFGPKVKMPVGKFSMRARLHQLVNTQNPLNSIQTKDSRIVKLESAKHAMRVYQQLCLEPKLSKPDQPTFFHRFVWGSKYTHPDPNKPPYRAVLHDVGYSFDDETWYNIFETTGITVANGYLFCPSRLAFPDMVEDPTYDLKLVPNHRKANPLAVWCNDNHWNQPVHTVARLTFKGDDGNGYQEDYDAWKSYLTRRIMLPGMDSEGHRKDFGYVLLLDIEERQGDYIIFNVTKTSVRINVPWTISVPKSQHFIQVFDILHHRELLNNPLHVLEDTRHYISVLESEWSEILLYIERTNPESRCFHLALTSAYRKAFAVLESHDENKRWKIDPSRLCSVVLVAILTSKNRQIIIDSCTRQNGSDNLFKTISALSETFLSMFTFTEQSITRLLGSKVELIIRPEMSKHIYEEYDVRDQFGTSLLPSDVGGHFTANLLVQPPSVVDKISCPVCKSLHPATVDGQIIKCEPVDDSSWEFKLSMEDIGSLGGRLSSQLSQLATVADTVGLHTVLTNAKKSLPLLPISHKVNVLVFLGGPGVGKTRFAAQHRANADTLVVSPYDLSQAYKSSPAKFMTQHKALTNTTIFSKVIVDEFQSMDLDLLSIILERTKPSVLELHGDPKQPNILENQGEGKSIVNHVLNKKKFTTHEYCLSYRCTLSSISILNNVYGYQLVTNSNTVDDIEFVPFNPQWFERNPSVPVISFNADTVASLLGTVPNPKFSVRAATGSTHKNLALVLTNDDANLMNVDSLAIVAISRHTHKLFIIYQSDNLLAQFQSRFQTDKLVEWNSSPPRPISVQEAAKTPSPLLEEITGDFTPHHHDPSADLLFPNLAPKPSLPVNPVPTVVASNPNPIPATNNSTTSTPITPVNPDPSPAYQVSSCGHPSSYLPFCKTCSPSRFSNVLSVDYPLHQVSNGVVVPHHPAYYSRNDTFVAHKAPGDGHCFYHSFAFWTKRFNQRINTNFPSSVQHLRMFLTHNYFQNKHIQDQLFKTENLDQHSCKPYIQGVSTNAWGSTTEAQALADLLNVVVHIVALKREKILCNFTNPVEKFSVLYQQSVLPFTDPNTLGKIPIVYLGYYQNHFVPLTPLFAYDHGFRQKSKGTTEPPKPPKSPGPVTSGNVSAPQDSAPTTSTPQTPPNDAPSPPQAGSSTIGEIQAPPTDNVSKPVDTTPEPNPSVDDTQNPVEETHEPQKPVDTTPEPNPPVDDTKNPVEETREPQNTDKPVDTQSTYSDSVFVATPEDLLKVQFGSISPIDSLPKSSLSQKEVDELSHTLSAILRHKGGKIVSGDGYALVSDVLSFPTRTRAGKSLTDYSLADIKKVVDTNNKNRFGLIHKDGNLFIRAHQGHSIKHVLTDKLLTPILDASKFPVCVHGTTEQAWNFIRINGLSKMKRNHIHFAIGLPGDQGVISGMRNNSPVIIYLDLAGAIHDGIKFFLSDNNTILSEGIEGFIPPKYFQKTTLNGKPVFLQKKSVILTKTSPSVLDVPKPVNIKPVEIETKVTPIEITQPVTTIVKPTPVVKPTAPASTDQPQSVGDNSPSSSTLWSDQSDDDVGDVDTCACNDKNSLYSLLLSQGYPRDVLDNVIHKRFSCKITENCLNSLATAIKTTIVQKTVVVSPSKEGRNSQVMYARPVSYGKFPNQLYLDVELDVTSLSECKWVLSSGPVRFNTIQHLEDLSDPNVLKHPVSWSRHGILVHVPADGKCVYSALEASARMVNVLSRFRIITKMLAEDQGHFNIPAVDEDYQKMCNQLACAINIHNDFSGSRPIRYQCTDEFPQFTLDILIHNMHAHGFLPAHHSIDTTVGTARRIAALYANMAGGVNLIPNPTPFHTAPQGYVDLTTHYVKPADESYKTAELEEERTFFAEGIGLRPYDGFRLAEDIISIHSNLLRAGEEFGSLTPTNISNLTKNMLNSRAKVNLANLIQPLNKNRTPLKDEIDRFRYIHSQGIDFLSSCPAQELRTAHSRYITSKGIKLTAASKQLAHRIASNFIRTYMEKVSDDPNEESETLNEALSDAIRKHYPERTRDFSTFDPHRINFFMKEIFKVSRSHITDPNKAGQGISAWDPSVVGLFHTLMRIMSRRFSRSLKSNAVFNNRLTQVQLISKVRTAMTTVHKSAIGGYMDGTQFDSCQNSFTQEIERTILTHLGMPEAAIEAYYSIRNDYTLSSNTFSALIDSAKTSGEPGTLLLNTILMMCLTAWLLRTVSIHSVIIGQGDDCFIYGIGLHLDQERLSDVGKFTKMKLKCQVGGRISFCGMSYNNGLFFLDLERRYKKIVGTTYRDYAHFAEVQNSVRDFLLDVKQSHTDGISSTVRANISVSESHPDYQRQFDYQLEVFLALESLAHINHSQFREHFKPISISRTYPM